MSLYNYNVATPNLYENSENYENYELYENWRNWENFKNSEKLWNIRNLTWKFIKFICQVYLEN